MLNVLRNIVLTIVFIVAFIYGAMYTFYFHDEYATEKLADHRIEVYTTMYAPTGEIKRTTTYAVKGDVFYTRSTSNRGSNVIYLIEEPNDKSVFWFRNHNISTIYKGTLYVDVDSIKLIK